jgi:pyruvyltransferase
VKNAKEMLNIQQHLLAPQSSQPILIYGAGATGHDVAILLAKRGHVVHAFLDASGGLDRSVEISINQQPGNIADDTQNRERCHTTTQRIPVFTLDAWLAQYPPENYGIVIAISNPKFSRELPTLATNLKNKGFAWVCNFEHVSHAFPELQDDCRWFTCEPIPACTDFLPVDLIYGNFLRYSIDDKTGELQQDFLNNFGDVLAPMIVRFMLEQAGIKPNDKIHERKRLLTIGSCLDGARTGDVVWGSGSFGGSMETRKFIAGLGILRASNLDVRALRGPLSREYLIRHGINAPKVFGDPGLLISYMRPDLILPHGASKYPYIVVPNIGDFLLHPELKQNEFFLDLRSPIETCLQTIARSRLVIASSLHAIIIAESLHIPAQLIRTTVVEKTKFRFEDYYAGTGRSEFRVANDLAEALQLGGTPTPHFSQEALLESFPYDLWQSASNVIS